MTTITYVNPAVAIMAGAVVLHERITWTSSASRWCSPARTSSPADAAAAPPRTGGRARDCSRAPCRPAHPERLYNRGMTRNLFIAAASPLLSARLLRPSSFALDPENIGGRLGLYLLGILAFLAAWSLLIVGLVKRARARSGPAS